MNIQQNVINNKNSRPTTHKVQFDCIAFIKVKYIFLSTLLSYLTLKTRSSFASIQNLTVKLYIFKNIDREKFIQFSGNKGNFNGFWQVRKSIIKKTMIIMPVERI